MCLKSVDLGCSPCQPPIHMDSQISQNNAPVSSSKKAGLILLSVFSASLLILFLVYCNFPDLESSERQNLKLPQNLEDAKNLGQLLLRYRDRYFYTVLSGVLVTYIFLQSFAIPGSLFLTILSGYLFSVPVALLLVCFCSAVGAGLCYLLFNFFGRPFVIRYFPDKVSDWSAEVKKHESNLLYYIIFLRITPILPNWFINVSSPVIGVPFTPFFFGTLFGVAPPSCVYIWSGKTLKELTSTAGLVSPKAMVVLFILGFLTLFLPRVFMKSPHEKES